MFGLSRKPQKPVSPSILVMDRDPDFVDTVRHRLECAKFRVATATDGQDGLEKAVSSEPNLILLDLRMPVTSNRGVIDSLRTDARLAKVPVIVWSPSAEIEDVTWAASFDISDYVTKPFYLPDLMVRILRTLASKE